MATLSPVRIYAMIIGSNGQLEEQKQIAELDPSLEIPRLGDQFEYAGKIYYVNGRTWEFAGSAARLSVYGTPESVS